LAKKRTIFIDFLRGLSVLGILFYHIVPGTPVGLGQGSMEFFFVISGYLITNSFIRRLGKGYKGLFEFVKSRLWRLIPALLLYLLFVGLVNFLNGFSLLLIIQSSFWSIAGFYNWFQIFSLDTIRGLGGIWSLSVEDQYYYLILLIGLGILCFKVKNHNKAFFSFYATIAIVSLLMRVFNFVDESNSLSWISYNTISRLWGFACGGLAALALAKFSLPCRKPIYVAFISIAGAYICLFTVGKYTAQSFLYGWLWAPAFFSFGVLCWMREVVLQNDEKTISNDLASKIVDSFFLKTCAYFISALRIAFVVVAKVGVACYPIYLFQESDKLLGIKLHWFFSIGWAIMLGFLIHCFWERRFYTFPQYSIFKWSR
jgi:peptidoglycan/LPS O-acetylase OafA/YrhL